MTDKSGILFVFAKRTTSFSFKFDFIGFYKVCLHLFLIFLQVSVFDFPTILDRTERRVRDDLLGAGPKTVEELQSIAGRLRLKYQNQLERKIQRAQQQQQRAGELAAGDNSGEVSAATPQQKVSEVMAQAGSMAGGLFSKIKAPSIQLPGIQPRKAGNNAAPPPPVDVSPTIVQLPPAPAPAADVATLGVEGDWVGLGTDIPPMTDAISNFSIGDEDDDDDL